MKKTIFTLTIMAFALLLYSQESDNTDASSMQLARKHGHLLKSNQPSLSFGPQVRSRVFS